MMFLVGICVALLAVALWLRGTGFARKSASEMEVGEPAIDIRTPLSGPIISEGVIYGPTGKVAGRFVADMLGTFDGRAGTLDEEFSFASGAKQRRKWNLTFNNDGTFTATADDIIGQATGRMDGSTVCMRYRLRLEEDAGGHVLDVTDWMYLMENGTVMNRSEMRKFGIKVGELIATMRPVANQHV